MFIDARTVTDGSSLQAAVCVVGGGVAGITLSLEFERAGVDVVLLESGGFDADEATDDLNRGDNAGLPFAWADGARSRHFGGSSNCWGGWCGPLRDHEMARRDWVPDSGWPFDRAALDPYYRRAHAVLGLGPYDYDVGRWVAKVGRPDVRRIPLPTGRVHDILTQFASPLRLGVGHRDALARAAHVRVYLHANVVDIETDPEAKVVRRVHVRTLCGRRLTVAADRFVLACGGIENARLLLAADKVQPGGLGNGHDLVGRYFADHPRLHVGSVRLAPRWRDNRLYDVRYHNRRKAVSADGTFVSAQFSLAPDVLERERLLNAQLWFASVLPGDTTGEADAMVRLNRRLRRRRVDAGHSVWGDLAKVARRPANTAGFVAARFLPPPFGVRDVRVTVVCEPAPDRDSRVTLSDRRDALGVRRVRVDWRLGELVRRTFDRSLAIFADELRAGGVAADVTLPSPLAGGGDWPPYPPTANDHMGTWHHMGTTRMSDSPAEGVVDADCRVHGVGNLYVAGSSVFPTCGANFPTITIVALALRLADHLTGRPAVDAATSVETNPPEGVNTVRSPADTREGQSVLP